MLSLSTYHTRADIQYKHILASSTLETPKSDIRLIKCTVERLNFMSLLVSGCAAKLWSYFGLGLFMERTKLLKPTSFTQTQSRDSGGEGVGGCRDRDRR